MYIVQKGSQFEVSKESKGAVARIEAPVYIENNREIITEFVEQRDNLLVYGDENNNIEISVESKGNGLFYLNRKWINAGSEKRRIQTVFRVYTCFDVEKYLIPCVNVNGNEFGAGFEPKGLERDGKKWIFGYDRVSIPSCTLTENDAYALALFASDESESSLVSSCSISRTDYGAFVQEIYHPLIELPVTYSSRDKYAEGYESFIELQSGESFSVGVYVSVSYPRWKNYGICSVLDRALEIFGDNRDMTVPDERSVWDNSIAFAKSLITDYKGKKGFIIGFHPDGNGGFHYRDDQCFELAWCGQNILFSRMLIEDYILTGNKSELDEAVEIVDTRVKYCTAKSGLLASQLKFYENLDAYSSDTCNMGYGAYELVRIYERLLDIGIEKPEYLKAARGLCDFFVEHFSDEYGFGKQWKLSGECIDKGGSIGAFVIPAMAALYKVTREEKYLCTAEKAMKFYVERDLDKFCCTAGALDTCCVDKETSAPFIMSATLLYELTGKDIYLEYGKKSAYYFTSWMFHYQPSYGSDSEISEYNVCIKGLTSVSAQHHHLDMYAGIVVPYIRKLADQTGDEAWRTRADMMWRAVLQYIGDGELEIHGVKRPVGSQNEALFHCRWAFGNSNRGCLNDWLVAWPCAFRMSVIAETINKKK